ncbi:MAG: GAF domain-containing protein, partial [Anaerolineae bacterium]
MKPTGTIVIAADRTAECQELEAMLEGEGYRFVFVSAPDRDAEAVADKLEGIDPDVVVIGTIDSRGRGVEICQALRKQPLLGDVPIVVVVGARNTELRDRYLDSGADDFVTRPLRPTALKSRLHALVRLNRYRRQLSQATNRHAAEVMVMNRIGQVITSVLDLKQALGAIGDHAQRLLDVAATSVVLYDDETGDLWFGAASGREAEHIEGRRLTHGQGIIHWVVENGQPAIVNDVAQNPGFSSEWDQQADFTTTSILCVPLRSKGRTIGAIEALNKASGRFDEEDLTLLASLAAWAAVAIENARLHHRTQQEIGERERIAAELHDLNRTLEEAIDERTRELQAERDRTQAILEAVGEAVIVTDLEGRIQYLNPAAAELTGYRLDELAGHQVWQHDVAPSHPARQTHTEPLLSTRRMELVSRRKDGTLYDVATTVAPLFDSQLPNRVMGYVYVQRDITPVKDAERMKDEFISNLSHELRTPLSVIALVTGNLDRLYDRLSDQRRRKLIGDMREHAQLLDDLIGDVL